MAAIPYSVALAFADGKRSGRGSFRATGRSAYSYGLRLAHYEWLGNGRERIVFDYLRLDQGGIAPSATTARHMRALEAVIALPPS